MIDQMESRNKMEEYHFFLLIKNFISWVLHVAWWLPSCVAETKPLIHIQSSK